MTTLDNFIEQLKTQAEKVEFSEVIEIIDRYYDYTPTKFTNGPHDDRVINNAGENQGSCKIFSFAKLHHLDESQTLSCFGTYYRNDVLKHPDKKDHANIRTFMKYGWAQLKFEDNALVRKSQPA